MTQLSEQVALVTGASRGVGRGIAPFWEQPVWRRDAMVSRAITLADV